LFFCFFLCLQGPDIRDATFAVLLGSNGECRQYLKLAHLKEFESPGTKTRPASAPSAGKRRELEELKQLIENERISAVAIGATDLSSRRLYDLAIRSLNLHKDVPIFYVETDIARVFQNSER